MPNLRESIENPVTGESMTFLVVVQLILFATLAPLGRAMGYTPDVPYE